MGRAKPAGPRTWLTAAEVAATLRVCKMTVHRMVARGELPAMRVGRRRMLRIPAAALTEYMAAAWTGEWTGDAPQPEAGEPAPVAQFKPRSAS